MRYHNLVSAILPVFLHYVIFNMVQMMRLHVDAASLTTMASLICLPILIGMMQKDEQAMGFGGKKGAGLTFCQAGEILGTALLMNLLLSVMVSQIAIWFQLENTAQEALFESPLLIQLFGPGIIVPIQEELLFRGLVYQRLKRYNKSWLSIVAASAAFALYHGNATQILFAFPMAIIMTLFYERDGTILAPILFHIVVNFSSILVSAGC